MTRAGLPVGGTATEAGSTEPELRQAPKEDGKQLPNRAGLTLEGLPGAPCCSAGAGKIARASDPGLLPEPEVDGKQPLTDNGASPGMTPDAETKLEFIPGGGLTIELEL